MAQTTEQLSGVANYVAISTDGSAWTDISGFASKVECDAQVRTSGETYTFDGDAALIAWGKKEPVEVTVTLVYTEVTTPPYATLYTAFNTAGGGRLQVRWAVKGATVSNVQYSTGSDSKVSEMPWPAPDATSGDPIVVEFKVKTATITKGTYAT